MTTLEMVAIVRTTVAERVIAQLSVPTVLALILFAVASFVCGIVFPEQIAESALLF